MLDISPYFLSLQIHPCLFIHFFYQLCKDDYQRKKYTVMLHNVDGCDAEINLGLKKKNI